MHALFYKFVQVTDYETNLDVPLRSFANVYFLLFLKNADYTISLGELSNFP